MGAMPEQAARLPGRRGRRAARARSRRRGARRSRRETAGTSREMFEAMERGELTALYVIGENPAQSEADQQHAIELLEGLDHLVVQDIFLTKTAQLADVVLPASASWCEAEGTVTSSASGACSACARRSTRPARRATTSRSSASSPSGSATTRGATRRGGVERAAQRSRPMHAGMSYARLEELGGIQWPCPDESIPGEQFLHARLWERAGRAGRARRSRRPTTTRRRPARRRVPDPAHDRPPARLVQHRRADRRLHARRCVAARALDLLARGRRAATASPTASACASSRGAARSRRRCATTPTLRPGSPS